MQTNSVYNQHHVYFVTSNDSGLIWPSAVTNTSDRNMTNLWLWNCVCNPWKLSRINTFHSTRKYSEFFKVWVNLSLNWPCFFSRWNLICVNFFRCLACDCNYRDEKLCNVSKADCIARDIAFKAQKLLEVSEVFWSFTCIFKSKSLCTQSRLTKSEGRNIKLRCYCESRNSNSGTSNVFSETTPWL